MHGHQAPDMLSESSGSGLGHKSKCVGLFKVTAGGLSYEERLEQLFNTFEASPFVIRLSADAIDLKQAMTGTS